MEIVLADDHALYRESVKHWLENSEERYRVVVVGSLDALRTRLARGPAPDLVLLDLCMPGMKGVDSVRALCSDWPEVPVMVVSANEDHVAIRGCVEAGVSGYLPKSETGEAMLGAIRSVLEGKVVVPSAAMHARIPKFSRKQMQILLLLAQGMGNREIAESVYLTEGTVKQYVSEILVKLGVDNRVQAAIRARQLLGLNS